MKASVLFEENKLVSGEYVYIHLSSTTSGHLCLPVECLPDVLISTREEEWRFPIETDGLKRGMRTPGELLEIHAQLGHASSRQIIALLNNGGF